MNAIHSHFTSRTLLILLAVACNAVSAASQEFEKAVKLNIWNISSNVNGIRQDTSRTVSFAEGYAAMDKGGFKSFSEAESPWRAGAQARSITHLKRFSMRGGFAFEQSQGDGMCGSMFLRDDLYPVDVIEFTPGRKTLQTYSFDGAVSVDITPAVRLGAGIDFSSSNWAKRKDLRHTNYRLDMEVTPGVVFHNGNVSIGLNYIYGRDTETIEAEQVGTGESTYYVFHDKGLMYGVYAPWSGSGVHLKDEGVKGFPVVRNTHGCALQAQKGGSLLELSYLSSSGRAGEKQFIWYRFPSTSWILGFSDRYDFGRYKLLSRLRHEYSRLSNSETVLEKVQENGITTVTEHGENRIFHETAHASSLEDELIAGNWELLLGLYRKHTSSFAYQMYPYVSERDMKEYSLVLAPVFHLKAADLRASLSFSGGKSGSGDTLSTEDSGVVSSPYRLEEYYDMDVEYKTAKRLGIELGARFHLPRHLYLKLDASLLKAFEIELLGSDMRYGALLGVGYEF